MPRARKTQAPKAASDQAYGQKGAALEAQAQIPLPQEQLGPEAVGGVAAAPGPPPAASFDEALMAAQMEGAEAFPTPLSAGTQRPGEPVMTQPATVRTSAEAEIQMLDELQLMSGSNEFRSLTERLMMTKRANGPKPSGTAFMPTSRRNTGGNELRPG